jgi:RNA polymerase sigma factor (sigma-70 family)
MALQEGPVKASSAPETRVSTRGLLARFQNGEASALELLFQREIPLLRRWARRRLPRWARSVVDTADLVQGALMRTLPNLARFEPRRQSALQAYLRTAVANQLRDELRRIGRAPVDQWPDGEMSVAAPDPQPDVALIAEEDQQRYALALEQLSETDRTAIVGRLQLGYSYEQMALLLDKRSANSARMVVTRAIVRLIDAMSDQASPRS